MASDRPSNVPPLTLRAEGADSDRELDASQYPLPRSASTANSNASAGRGRSGSVASRSTRTPPTGVGQMGHVPRSPSSHVNSFNVPSSSGSQSLTYSMPSSPPVSSTHAGGIQPSAPFFHPSRPNNYSDFSAANMIFSSNYNAYPIVPMSSIPRSTGLVNANDQRPESTGSDSFAHASFSTEEFGNASGGRDRGGSVSNANTMTATSTVARSFSTKVSREPLLPIGQKPKPPKLVARPSISGGAPGNRIPGLGGHSRKKSDGNGSGGSGSGGSTSGGGTGARVRTSLEKFLRRTLSGDASMSTSSFMKESRLPTNAEELDARGRSSADPYIEFKSHPDIAIDEEGTMNITHNTSASPSLARRMGKNPYALRFPNFNPVPPDTKTLASRTPILSDSGKPKRRYRLHRSQNLFFLNGNLLTGGDSPWPFVASLFVVLGLAGTWSGTTAVWWWKRESPAVAIIGAYMCLLTIANMLSTAFTDPGILPRNLDPDPPYPNSTPSDEAARIPLPRDLKVRSGVVRVKYCQTCRIYRPPRSSHCRMCDNCVDGCDHHCQWVNNCVGRRNYTSFIVFLLSATLTLCLIICTSALHLVLQARQENISAGASLRKGAGSAVVFVVSVIVVSPVSGLLGYHMRLLLLNLTTIEQIRNSAHKTLVRGPAPPNPFAFGSWRNNLAEMLCRPRGMSWLEASAIATEDLRAPNPGSEIRERALSDAPDAGGGGGPATGGT